MTRASWPSRLARLLRSGRRSLRLTILTAFASIFVVGVGLIIAYSYQRNSQAVLRSSNDLFRQASDRVLAKTVGYLTSPRDAVRVGAGLLGRGTLSLARPDGIQRYLVELVHAHPQVVMAYFTHRTGNHLGIERAPDGTLSYWRIQRAGDRRTLRIYRLLPTGRQILKSTQTQFAFHPRQRPWFRIPRRTGHLHVTDAYAFFSSKKNQLGITVSYPVRTRSGEFLGVLAADIELERLSHFVGAMAISPHGKVLIVDGRDQLIAYPDYTKVFQSGGAKPRIRAVRELAVGWLTAGLSALGDHRAHLTSYSHDGDRFLLSQHPLPASLGTHWRVVVAAPEDDFVGSLKETNRNVILVALLVLFLGVFVIAYLSSRISRPIVQLAEETRRIQSFDLEGRPEIRSPVSEIQLLDESVAAMKASLLAFRKFVPAELVREILATREGAAIGGEVRELSLFFSDIRDFTAISEPMAPQDLMEFLSEYLEALTAELLAEGATIDKFIGDAIMAFWNAPLDRPDHAARACRAALACQARLATLNARWAEAGRAPLVTRIGLHTGRAVVGNIGSSDRLNYTALGDSVNLASRLEGANKLYGTTILVSESTREQAGDAFVFRILDRLVVKGRRAPVTIHELLCARNAPDAPAQRRLAEGFAEGFEHYLQRRWGEAIEVCSSLAMAFPDDPVIPRLIARCEQFQRTPPDPDWQGELRSTTK